MKKTLLMLLALSLAGCLSEDRQVFKARQIFDKYPDEAAKYCGDKFPVTDSIANISSDTTLGKTMDYAPVIANFEMLLDSAKVIVGQKQDTITDLAGQLRFAKIQLTKATILINSLSLQINSIKANYKPCGVDTIKNTYTKIRANTAKILALTAQVVQDGEDKGKMQNTLQEETKTATSRLYWIIGFCIIIAGYLGFKVYKLFSGGAIAGILSHL